MGIKGLNKIIKRVAPYIIKEKCIYEYTGTKIAIDSSILMYKYRYSANNSEDSHIYGFLQRVCFYLKRGILPIFVFDGIPPNAKQNVLEQRVQQKNRIQEKINNLTQSRTITTEIQQEIDKLNKQITYVTKYHRQECKYLLKLIGVPVIEANGEAEATCAELQKKGIVSYTYTEDSDALTFGAPVILKSARKLEKVIEISLGDILKELDLTNDEFIDFCILCGCDYTCTIPKIGPITSLALVQEHKNIESILNTLPEKYHIPDNFNYELARKLFKQSVLLPEFDISLGNTKYRDLENFLLKEKNIPRRVCENLTKNLQNSFSEYFGSRKHDTRPSLDSGDLC